MVLILQTLNVYMILHCKFEPERGGNLRKSSTRVNDECIYVMLQKYNTIFHISQTLFCYKLSKSFYRVKICLDCEEEIFMIEI